MSRFSSFMTLSVCMTPAKQLVVTGSDTALTVSLYSVPTTTRHQLLRIRASQLSFLSCETYFITIKICITLSALPDSQPIRDQDLYSKRGRCFALCAFPVLNQLKTFAIQLLVYGKKKRIGSYIERQNDPIATFSLTSCIAGATEPKMCD